MISKRVQRFLVLGVAATLSPLLSQAQLVTTITDFKWLGERLCRGTPIQVQSLLRGNEDPHHVDASPGFVRKLTEAKVLAQVGLDLEVGWLPRALARASNPALTPGQGLCDLSAGQRLMEVRTGPVDRSMGDVHPGGNPHYWLGYLEMGVAGTNLMRCLARAFPAQHQRFLDNLKEVQGELAKALTEDRARIKGRLSGTSLFFEYHREYSYWLNALGLMSRAALESKPGVAPSAGRIAEVAEAARLEKALFLLSAPYYPQGVHAKFTELSGVPVLQSYAQWMPDTAPDPLAQRRALLDQMLERAKPPSAAPIR